MRPTKNHKFCVECNRAKILFESEPKALKYIKLNYDEIFAENGKAPIRAYYCKSCCGWHVTSKGQASDVLLQSNAEEDTNDVSTDKKADVAQDLQLSEEIKAYYDNVSKKIDSIENMIAVMNYSEAIMRLNMIRNCYLEKYASSYLCLNQHYALKKRVVSLQERISKDLQRFDDCIGMGTYMDSMKNDLDVADILIDSEEYADAKLKVLNVLDILAILKDKYLYEDERAELKTAADKLLNRLSFFRFADKKPSKRITDVKQLLKKKKELPTISIRMGVEDDMFSIVEFQLKMAKETEGRILDIDIVEDGVASVLGNNDKGFYLIAEYGNSVIGSLMVTKEWSDWNDMWYYWVQSVYVSPEHRKEGIFSQMYKKVKEIALENGTNIIRLYVDQNNTNAKVVYSNLGMHRSNYEMYEEMIE